jgi:hypothetical protein
MSTIVDETTKRQFDDICAKSGISPSGAINMFIMGVIDNKGIPFDTAVSQDNRNVRPPFAFGCMRGQIWMSEDFDEPLDDFKEYME